MAANLGVDSDAVEMASSLRCGCGCETGLTKAELAEVIDIRKAHRQESPKAHERIESFKKGMAVAPSARRPLVKAKSDPPVLVYDESGRAIGLVDPGKLQAIARTPEPPDLPAANGDGALPAELLPQPKAAAGVATDVAAQETQDLQKALYGAIVYSEPGSQRQAITKAAGRKSQDRFDACLKALDDIHEIPFRNAVATANFQLLLKGFSPGDAARASQTLAADYFDRYAAQPSTLHRSIEERPKHQTGLAAKPW